MVRGAFMRKRGLRRRSSVGAKSCAIGSIVNHNLLRSMIIGNFADSARRGEQPKSKSNSTVDACYHRHLRAVLKCYSNLSAEGISLKCWYLKLLKILICNFLHK